MRLALLAVIALAAPAAAERDDRLGITGTATFSIGALDAGLVDGIAVPGGHFDLGASFANLRVQAELDAGLWSNEGASPEMPESGSYRRWGGALRYYWQNLAVRTGRLRLFVEGGVGKQYISSRSISASGELERPDIAFGFGMAQEARLGSATLGGYFGLRIQLAEAPTNAIACRADVSCDTPRARPYDVGLFFMFGLAVGR